MSTSKTNICFYLNYVLISSSIFYKINSTVCTVSFQGHMSGTELRIHGRESSFIFRLYFASFPSRHLLWLLLISRSGFHSSVKFIMPQETSTCFVIPLFSFESLWNLCYFISQLTIKILGIWLFNTSIMFVWAYVSAGKLFFFFFLYLSEIFSHRSSTITMPIWQITIAVALSGKSVIYGSPVKAEGLEIDIVCWNRFLRNYKCCWHRVYLKS